MIGRHLHRGVVDNFAVDSCYGHDDDGGGGGLYEMVVVLDVRELVGDCEG